MRLSLRSLVTDLEIRARIAREALEDRSGPNERTADAIASISHTESEARRLLGEDLDEFPDHFYPTYQKLTQALFERETFELPFLLYHDLAATRATALSAELLRNIRWPFPPVLVGTFSSQYYWTLPYWRVIAEPVGEERRLLGIGDLCHELGHTIYSRSDQLMVNDFPIALGAHLQEQATSPSLPIGVEPLDYLTDVFFSWQEAWLQEFVCDLIATYLVGPAFPRQHARLRAMTQPLSPIFELKPGSTHPADDARMQVSLAHIAKFGFDTEADQLRKIWNEIVAASGERRPDAYDILYPTALLEQLAETVAEGCVKLGLRPYEPDVEPMTDMPRLANEAWDQLESNPSGYADWEQSTIASLWTRWGV